MFGLRAIVRDILDEPTDTPNPALIEALPVAPTLTDPVIEAPRLPEILEFTLMPGDTSAPKLTLADGDIPAPTLVERLLPTLRVDETDTCGLALIESETL